MLQQNSPYLVAAIPHVTHRPVIVPVMSDRSIGKYTVDVLIETSNRDNTEMAKWQKKT